jgi:hypothetical protein
MVTTVAILALFRAPEFAGEDTGAATFDVTAIVNPH